MFKVQKPIDKANDRVLYVFNEQTWKSQQERPRLRLPTFYFDDIVKIDIFHKGSSIKTNMCGKGILSLSEISLDAESIAAVPIFNKKLLRVTGYVYVKARYQPRA